MPWNGLLGERHITGFGEEVGRHAETPVQLLQVARFSAGAKEIGVLGDL
jgi:hypothetical protein